MVHVEIKVNRQRAFSLLELMTVIGIVGILAALSFAALVHTKSKSNDVVCLGNIRQMSTALQRFLSDNHVYPMWFNGLHRNGDYPEHRRTWMQALFPEMPGTLQATNGGVLRCPSAVPPPNYPKSEGYDHYGYNARGMSGMNASEFLGLGGFVLLTQTYVPLRESEVINPAEMLAIGDGYQGWGQVIIEGKGLAWRRPAALSYAFPGCTAHSMRRHHGKANYAFCDGHVEAVSLNVLFTDTSDTALRKWNRDNLPHRESLQP